MRRPLRAIVILAVLIGGTALAWRALDRQFGIVILIGQSNMEGRGDPADLPADFPTHSKDIWQFTDAEWKLARDTPLPNGRVGPAIAIADDLISNGAAKSVGFVLCAAGNTAIDRWQPGSARYVSCLERIKRARRSNRIIGAAFYQGESDTSSMQDVNAWPSKFQAIVAALRSDLGQTDLPFVMAVIGKINRPSDARFKYWQEMQGVQRAISIPGVSILEASPFPIGKDGIHLTTKSQLGIASNFAGAILAGASH